MKEILHDRMFESGSYKSHPIHLSLYQALEASIERDNREEFFEDKDKSRKRRCDDQDPPPPPLKDSDRQKSSISSKQKQASPSVQPINEDPIPDDVHLLDSEDISVAHIPKIKNRTYYLKPVPEEDRPATPEPEWVIPLNDLPEVENNWADALAQTYKARFLRSGSYLGSFSSLQDRDRKVRSGS
ncbi:hypothetical protein Tco_0186587 [Tanacetum coccineum]